MRTPSNPLTQPAPSLLHPKLAELYTFWLSRCAGDQLPVAGDLEPSDLRPWLGNLLIIDASENGDYVYSFYGRSFAEAFGEDKLGHSIGELPEPAQAILKREYQRVRLDRVPVSRTYTADFQGVQETWERLVLPLTSDGITIEKLLVAAFKL